GLTGVLGGQNAASQAAVPMEPITAIINEFRLHTLVGLGEGAHDNEQGHQFRLSLIRDPRFVSVVNDIVVEFGSARHQEIMDRFARGEDVPYNTLRQIWQDTTQPHTLWDAPIYEEFFRTVRVVNMSLPRERQIRVLLGDPPVDWASVKTGRDIENFGNRDLHPATMIRREVLAKQRRALIIYGDAHLFRKNPNTPPPSDPEGWALSIVGLLESGRNEAGTVDSTAPRTKVFTIRTVAGSADLETIQPKVLSWPRPSFVALRGTDLGAQDLSFYSPRPLVAARGEQQAPPDRRRALRMEDQFDALLYLGPSTAITFAQLSPTLCS